MDQKYADPHYGQGEIHRILAEHAFQTEADVEPPAAAGLRSLAQALRLKPDLGGALEERARLQLLVARQRAARGSSPEGALRAATADLDRALALNARSSDACRLRGELLRLEAQRARDAGRTLADAQGWLVKATRLNRHDVAARLGLAAIAEARATARAERGEDPADDVRQGLTWLEPALALARPDPRALAQKGVLQLALARSARGAEAERLSREAFAAMDEAVRRNGFLARGLAPPGSTPRSPASIRAE